MEEEKKLTRREFVEKSIPGKAEITLGMTAKSYANIIGENDRIQIGQIGTGHRASGHREMIKLSKNGGKNFALRSICDIWSGNLERSADQAKEMFGTRPKTYKYAEDMLVDRDLGAVMIATGDHQHVFPVVKAVKAGKDVYVGKPLTNRLDQAKLARKTINDSDRVVQSGEQWVSEPHQIKFRDIIRSGMLGEITKIEQSWNFYRTSESLKLMGEVSLSTSLDFLLKIFQ